MEKSNSIKNIAAALLKFHASVGKIKKDANNPFFKSKYATLSNILDAIGAPLETAGLAYSQLPDGNNGLTTILMHPESGEYLQSTYEMHPVKNDPQGVGSAMTYARRYALAAILGLNIDEDDDGNAASNKTNKTAEKVDNKEVLATWQAEVLKCKTLAELTAFYNSNREVCDAHADIKAVFTTRRKQLEKQQQPA